MSKQEENRDGEISMDALEAVLGIGENPEQQNTDSEEKSDLEDVLGLEEEPSNELNQEPEKSDEEGSKEKEEASEKETIEETILNDDTTSAFQKAKLFIESGLIEDVRVRTSEDDEEGTPLSELKDLDEEQLLQVIEAQKNKKDESIKKNYISKEKFSEDKLKVIEILEKGGEISDIFETPEEARRPYLDMDIENERDQATMLFSFYQKHKGISGQEALPILQKLKAEGQLKDAAEKVFEYENKLYDQKLEQKAKDIEKAVEEEEKRLKEVANTLKSKLKEENLNDNISKNLINSVTKVNKDGYFPVEEAFMKILENPQENFEKILHIIDEKAYNELKKIKTQKKTTGKVLEIIDAIPKARKKQQEKEQNITKNDIFSQLANEF